VEPPRLPMFEGQQPLAVRSRISGKTSALKRGAAIGETVILLVEATVTEVNHATDTHGILWRDHKLTLDEAWELPKGDALAEEARRQIDQEG